MSSAELVYGSALRLPGELLPDPNVASVPQADFLKGLQNSLRAALPLPVVHHGRQLPHVPSALDRASFVYVRVDSVRPPLVRPYEGPFRIIAKDGKTFKLLRNGRPWIVSADRLKPAFCSTQLSVPGSRQSVLSPSAQPFLPFRARSCSCTGSCPRLCHCHALWTVVSTTSTLWFFLTCAFVIVFLLSASCFSFSLRLAIAVASAGRGLYSVSRGCEPPLVLLSVSRYSLLIFISVKVYNKN